MFSYWARPEDAPRPGAPAQRPHRRCRARHPTRFVGPGHAAAAGPRPRRRRARALRRRARAGRRADRHARQRVEPRPARAVPGLRQGARELGAAVFVHPWDMLGARARCRSTGCPGWSACRPRPALAICSMIFGGVLERLPALRIALRPRRRLLSRAPSGGSSTASTSGPTCARATTPSTRASYLGRFYVDSLVHDAATLRYLSGPGRRRADRARLGLPVPARRAAPGRLIESLDRGWTAPRRGATAAGPELGAGVSRAGRAGDDSVHERRRSPWTSVRLGPNAVTRSVASATASALPLPDPRGDAGRLLLRQLARPPAADVDRQRDPASWSAGPAWRSTATSRGTPPWYSYHELFREPLAPAGRRPAEARSW